MQYVYQHRNRVPASVQTVDRGYPPASRVMRLGQFTLSVSPDVSVIARIDRRRRRCVTAIKETYHAAFFLRT